MNRGEIILLTVLLGGLSTVTTISIDGMLPAIPAIGAAFDADGGTIKFGVTVFILGMAFGQLIHGPLSDRYGRKKILVGGVFAYALVSLACAQVTSVEQLLALRFVQGLAACSGGIVSRAVIRDRWTRDAAASLIGYVMVIHGLMPLIAPIIGARLTVALGWQSVFYGMAIFGATVGVLVLFLLRESLTTPDRSALRVGAMMRNYAVIMRSRPFWGYLVCNAAAYGGLFAFLTGSPGVLISSMGVTPEIFSYLFGIAMTGHLLGLLLGARLVRRLGLDRTLAIGVGSLLTFGLLGAVLAWSGSTSIAAIIVPVFFYLGAFALILPQCIAGAISPFPQMAGAASSLMGFLSMCGASAFGATTGLFDDGTELPMMTVIGASGIVAVVAYWLMIHPSSARGAAGRADV